MMKKIFLVSMTLGLFVLLCGALGAPAAEKPILLRYATLFPTSFAGHQYIVEWCTEIEKRTNGRVKITLFPSETLLKGPDTYDGVAKGTADIGTSTFAYNPGRFPIMESIEQYTGFKSGEVAGKIIWEIYKKFDPKELKDTHVLYIFSCAPALIHTVKKPVHRLEDIRDLKLRAVGTLGPKIRALGAIPVAMSSGEQYEALQKGIVDGTVISPGPLEGYKLAGIIKHTTKFSIGLGGFYAVMNLDKWNSLPRDIQEVFDGVSKDWGAYTSKGWDKDETKSLEWAVTKQGVELITLPPEEEARWLKALRPIMDDYIVRMEAKGVPGREIATEIDKLLGRYQK